MLTVFLFCFAAQAFEVPEHSDEWLSRKQPNTTDSTAANNSDSDPYYTAIGAYQNVPNFTAWKEKFGFADFTTITILGVEIRVPILFNSPKVSAKYFNQLDLGIGREMHCSKFNQGRGVACYVSNYGELPLSTGVTPELERETLAAMHEFTNRGDTVAMTYDLARENGYRVQFYIYNTKGGKSNNEAPLQNDIKLDSEGAKASPGLCLSCHGGTYETTNNIVTGASFLPFDPSLFGYEDDGEIQQGRQEAAFKKINSYVLATNPTPAIKKLITGLYRGIDQTDTEDDIYSNGSLSNANADYVPEGWAGHEDKYRNVAQKYCLMCHMAIEKPFQDLTFQTSANFYENFFNGCRSKEMPHAEVPYNDFWESGVGAENCFDVVKTAWLDRDDPGDTGDYETLNSFINEGQNICNEPVAIECRTRDGHITSSEAGEVYSCTPNIGGVCKKSDQADRRCLDYEVRFQCRVD